jgi:hypothetical protein
MRLIIQYGPVGGGKFALVHQRTLFCSFNFTFYKGFTIMFLGNIILPLIAQEKKACLA